MCPARHRSLKIGWLAIATVLLMGRSVPAQDVTEPALKAVFIYNFAKFTDWPVDPAQATEPFVLCVVGDAAVGDALVRTVRARVLAGQKLSVSSRKPGEPLTTCRLLYISGTAREAAPIVARLRDMPVLTISDIEGFAELGGIASFFFESGQLRFSVNLESAHRAHLRISSQLLVMAKPK